MAEVTVDDVLVASRDFLADPANVVKDPRNLFEKRDGRTVYADVESAERGCFVGAFAIVAYRAGLDAGERSDLIGEVERIVEPHLPVDALDLSGSFANTLAKHGHEGCVAVLDQVIASRRGGR